MQIFNTKYSSKVGVSSNNYIGTNLSNNKKLLPTNDFIGNVNEMEVYNQERENCTKIRLITTIAPYCTNVLFNRLTEVVYKEGSNQAACLNYALSNSVIKDLNVVGKESGNLVNPTAIKANYDLTRDTQLSSNEDISYHCGLDIFNNHILRSQTFKTVNQAKGTGGKILILLKIG